MRDVPVELGLTIAKFNFEQKGLPYKENEFKKKKKKTYNFLWSLPFHNLHGLSFSKSNSYS